MSDDTTQSLARRTAMAMGREAADLCVCNAKVVDVFSRRIHENLPVLVGDGVFLGFHQGPAHNTVDAHGAYLLPGLVDSHVHIESSLLTPPQFARLVLPHGTTTVVADPHEIANVLGVAGIAYMLESSRHLPLDVRISLPSCVPATPFEHAGAVLEAADIAPFMAHPQVVGLGEMMNYPGVINGDPQVLAKIALALDCPSPGKQVDGHSPSVHGIPLSAYAAAGIRSDHECSTVEELQERILRGMYVLLRQGSATHNLPTLVRGVTSDNAHRCLLCTDDRHPGDILRHGHLDHLLRLAVQHGLDPLLAVSMASLHAAQCYGLHNKGGIAPSRDADFLLVDNLRDFTVHEVYARGVKVAEAGHLCPLVEAALKRGPTGLPAEVTRSVHLAPLSPQNFALPLRTAQARVMGLQPRSLITSALTLPVQSTGGFFDSARNPELTKVAVVERHHASGHVGLGLLHGYVRGGHADGSLRGAIATTIAHDSHNIVVAGDNDADMCAAVEALHSLGGGIVLLRAGKVCGSLALPVAGLMTNATAEEVSQSMEDLIALAREDFGIHPQAEPFMTLSFMALPVIPELKLTDQGLFDVTNFCFTPLEVA